MDVHAAYEFCLDDKAAGDPPIADYADAVDVVPALAQSRAGNIFRALKVNDFAVFVQIVELPDPIRTDREDVDVVALNVDDFLPDVLFDDNFVREARFLHVFDSG